MSRNLQTQTEPEQMHGVVRWLAIVGACALLFGPTLLGGVVSLRQTDLEAGADKK